MKRLTNITHPTLTLFRPAEAKDTGASVVIAPGGGYNILAWDLEGEEVAAWLNSIGVTGIVLKYRVPRREGTPSSKPPVQALMDAQRAISLVRSKAGEWGLDPKRIGMLGFSAGGHLTAWASTHFDERAYPTIDDVDKVSCRPDFAVLIYPGDWTERTTPRIPSHTFHRRRRPRSWLRPAMTPSVAAIAWRCSWPSRMRRSRRSFISTTREATASAFVPATIPARPGPAGARNGCAIAESSPRLLSSETCVTIEEASQTSGVTNEKWQRKGAPHDPNCRSHHCADCHPDAGRNLLHRRRDCRTASGPGAVGAQSSEYLAAPSIPYGSRVSRAMRLLATSTPEHKHRVRVLFYGQSITFGWTDIVLKDLQNTHESAKIRELSEKYGYEVVDIRPSWQKYLALHHMDRKELLSDVVHLKPNGIALMASMVVPHLRYDPQQQPAGLDRVRYYDGQGSLLKGSFDDATVVALARPLRFEFEGNRVDVAAAADGKFGTARILIDGKKPSTFRGMYAATRTNSAPGSWFPAIRCVKLGEGVVPENWELTITRMNDECTEFEYEVKGSVTGPDGKGKSKEKFMSNSGRLIIEPDTSCFASAHQIFKKPVPIGFKVTWRVYGTFQDEWKPRKIADPAKENLDTLAQGLPNGKHVLEIIPNGDGDLPVRYLVVYQPMPPARP